MRPVGLSTLARTLTASGTIGQLFAGVCALCTGPLIPAYSVVDVALLPPCATPPFLVFN